jgi:hypothetical protein
MIDQDQRRQHFIAACELLGGQRPVARILGVSDRTVRYLVAGDLTLTRGFMRDITAALRDRGTACRALAAQTDPLFSANWTPEEAARQEKARG